MESYVTLARPADTRRRLAELRRRVRAASVVHVWSQDVMASVRILKREALDLIRRNGGQMYGVWDEEFRTLRMERLPF